MGWDRWNGQSIWEIPQLDILWNILVVEAGKRNIDFCNRLIVRIKKLEELDNTYGHIPDNWKDLIGK